MQITYFRSSSYNEWDFCQHKYYISYVLGWQDAANIKAEKGTCVHKVLELLAIANKCKQDKNRINFDDEIVGKRKCKTDKFLEPYPLKDHEIDEINFSRTDKYIYKTDASISKGHIRFGVDFVNELFDVVYDYYSSESEHDWTDVDRMDCLNWLWMALDYNNGAYDPRKRGIFEPEKQFDIEIKKPWAKYKYGDKEGYLSIKGTIDLVTNLDENTLEVVDWKTGGRFNWNTFREKTYEDLTEDFQLMFYYYALKHLYPDKDVILTIFFVRDGGPYTFAFDEDTIEAVEAKLKRRFEYIKRCDHPRMVSRNQSHKKCTKLCHFYKHSFDDHNENMCRCISDAIKSKGLDWTTDNMMNEHHNIDKYHAPG